MAIHNKTAVTLYICVIINLIYSNAFKSRSNTGHTLATKAMYM